MMMIHTIPSAHTGPAQDSTEVPIQNSDLRHMMEGIPVPQAICMIDIISPDPISWDSQVCHHVVHGIAHGDGGQAIVLWDHLDYTFRALVKMETQPPRRPNVEVGNRWPLGKVEHLSDEPLKAASAWGASQLMLPPLHRQHERFR